MSHFNVMLYKLENIRKKIRTAIKTDKEKFDT